MLVKRSGVYWGFQNDSVFSPNPPVTLNSTANEVFKSQAHSYKALSLDEDPKEVYTSLYQAVSQNVSRATVKQQAWVRRTEEQLGEKKRGIQSPAGLGRANICICDVALRLWMLVVSLEARDMETTGVWVHPLKTHVTMLVLAPPEQSSAATGNVFVWSYSTELGNVLICVVWQGWSRHKGVFRPA